MVSGREVITTFWSNPATTWAATGSELSCRIRIGWRSVPGSEGDGIRAKSLGNDQRRRRHALFHRGLGGGSRILGQNGMPLLGYGACAGGERRLAAQTANQPLGNALPSSSTTSTLTREVLLLPMPAKTWRRC